MMTREQAQEIYREWSKKGSENGFLDLLESLGVLRFDGKMTSAESALRRINQISLANLPNG